MDELILYCWTKGLCTNWYNFSSIWKYILGELSSTLVYDFDAKPVSMFVPGNCGFFDLQVACVQPFADYDLVELGFVQVQELV